jgi:MFS family permease
MRLQGAISGGDVDRKVRVTESADTTLVRGSRRYILLAATSIGALLAPLNSTMIAIALPEIRGDFDVDHASLGWLISSYLIVMAVAQPLGGRLGDQIGRKRVIRWALVAFLGFSLASVVAPSFWVLVLFRTGQAIAGQRSCPTGWRCCGRVCRSASSAASTGSTRA